MRWCAISITFNNVLHESFDMLIGNIERNMLIHTFLTPASAMLADLKLAVNKLFQ